MSVLVDSFGNFGGGGGTSHFVVAGAIEGAAGGANTVSLPGIAAGDIALLLGTVFFGGSGGVFASGDNALANTAPGTSGNPTAKASWHLVTSGDAAAGSINVSASAGANLSIAVFRIGTSVLGHGFNFDDGSSGSPESGFGFTKDAASKVCAWCAAGPSGFSTMSAGLGSQVYQSPGKGLTWATVDPSSGYVDLTPCPYTYTSNNVIFIFAFEIK